MNRRAFITSTAISALGLASGLFSPLYAEDVAMEEGAKTVPDLILGDMDAPIELIEYASYTCPHCKTFHENVFKDLKADYIDTGKVKFVYREVYFDKFGLWAAMLARCGGDMRYFGIQDMLFEKQSDWIAGGSDPMAIVENLRTIGKTAGLTDGDLDSCLNDGEMAQAMVAKFTEEVEEYDVSGTPTLVINGEKHSNMSYVALKEILDGLLDG